MQNISPRFQHTTYRSQAAIEAEERREMARALKAERSRKPRRTSYVQQTARKLAEAQA